MPPQDPYGDFNFLVEIDGIPEMRFAECTGIGASVDVIEYREGGEPLIVRKLPGRIRYSNIILRWGETDSHALYDWFREIASGRIQRRNGSIVLLDAEGQGKVRWNFVRGWPARWEGPHLNAKGTGVAIETLEIAHEGIQRVP